MKKWISFVIIGLTPYCLECVWAGSTSGNEGVIPVVAVSAGPSDNSANISRARQFIEKKNWTEAVGVLRILSNKDPQSLPVMTDLAMALTYSGNRGEALGVLTQGIKKSKGDAKVYLIRRIGVLSFLFLTNKTFQTYQDGLNFMMGKKYRNARERFEKALLDEPDNVEILTRLGQGFLLDNDPEKAVIKFRKATLLNAYQPDSRLWLGRALFQMGKFNDAVVELTSASSLLKGSELATVWLAEALTAGGQASTAIALLDNDVKQWPLHVLSLLNLARLRTQLPRQDAQTLWSARKELQLAISRLDVYSQSDFTHYSGDLAVDLSRSSADIKSEIVRLQQQIESHLNQVPNQR